MVRVFQKPQTIIDNFKVGMLRDLPEFVPVPEGVILNLGAGEKQIEGSISLGKENGWFAPKLPFDDGSIAAVYAQHFLEHLTGSEVVEMFEEVERVLKPGGVMNIVVPHYSSECAHQDLDHKTAWTESSFKNLFENKYYKGDIKRNWDLIIRTVVVMGLVERNMVVVAQLVKA